MSLLAAGKNPKRPRDPAAPEADATTNAPTEQHRYPSAETGPIGAPIRCTGDADLARPPADHGPPERTVGTIGTATRARAETADPPGRRSHRAVPPTPQEPDRAGSRQIAGNESHTATAHRSTHGNNEVVEEFEHLMDRGARPGDALLDCFPRARSWFARAELLVYFAHRYSRNPRLFACDHLDSPDPMEDRWIRHDAEHALPRKAIGNAGELDAVEQLVELLAAKRGNSSDLADTALQIARVIGERRGGTFEADFWKDSPHVLCPGRAIPEFHCNPQQAIGTHNVDGNYLLFNTPPSKLPPGCGAIKGMRLAGEAARWFEFELANCTQYDPLAELGKERPLVIATCHVNYTFEELHVPYDAEPEPKPFRIDGPINRPRQLQLLKMQIAEAARLGATIVVIPEYALHRDDRKELRDHIRTLDPKPLLVVAGTSPVVRNENGVGEPANETQVWSFGEPWNSQDEPLWSQDKIYTARIKYLPPELAKGEPFVERVARGRRIQVFRFRRWVVAVLVCRDAMSHQIVDQLADLGVNLCLVASSSPHSASIISSLATLRTRSQAFTVVANTTAKVEGVHVLDVAFDGPFEDPPGPVVRTSDQRDAPGPGIWVWSPTADRRKPAWYPTELGNRSPAGWAETFCHAMNATGRGEDDVHLMARLSALHTDPTTWRIEEGTLANGDAVAEFLGGFGRATLAPPAEEPVVHGPVAIVRLPWRPGPPDPEATWTAVLVRQPDEGWLCVFHDPWSRPSPAPDQPVPAELTLAQGRAGDWPYTPNNWEDMFIERANVPGAAKRSGGGKAWPDRECVENSVQLLLSLYVPGATYMYRPGRAAVGKNRINQGLRAVLSRGPEFQLLPGKLHHHGSVAVQTCLWRLRDMGDFPEESGHSTVVLIQQSGGWRCIYDDPWSKLSGPTRLDPAPDWERNTGYDEWVKMTTSI